MALISIITINYNDKEGLERTTQSVFDQSMSDYEYIIIDGGSKDGSVEYLESIKSQLNFWISEPDNGVYHAMNKGILQAKGDYLLFLNSGDHFKNSDSIMKLMPYINTSDVIEFIYGNIEVVAQKTWIKTYPAHLSLDYFIKGSLPHPATLIHKKCFENEFYDIDLGIVADWKFFMIGIVDKSYKYKYVDELITVFYYDGISSLNPEKNEKERRRVIEEFYPDKLSLHDYYYPSKLKVLKNKAKGKFRLLKNKLTNKKHNNG